VQLDNGHSKGRPTNPPAAHADDPPVDTIQHPKATIGQRLFATHVSNLSDVIATS
jgi:hypothetical protein